MGTGIPGLGFKSNCLSNTFQNLVEGSKADHRADNTLLRLDPIGSTSAPHFPMSTGVKRKWCWNDGNTGSYVDPSLCLGLGRSLSSSDSKSSTLSSCKETEVESAMDLELGFTLHLAASEKSPNSPKKKPTSSNWKRSSPQLDLELSLSTGPTESDITSIHEDLSAVENYPDLSFPFVPTTEVVGIESSSPYHWRTETSSVPTGAFNLNPNPEKSDSPFIPADISTTTSMPKAPKSSKMCKFTGCVKGARGASGLCIAHGGGRRCQRPGCTKGAEGRTAFCKAHGGGRRCEFLGCTKSAEGRTDFCIAHGGGRRCGHEGCPRAARGRSGLCIRHGGGKRCQVDGCSRSAEGLSGLCISHGGGRRCQFPVPGGCAKGAQGSTMFCKAHGGGKRCTVEGCTKGAEGSTSFCKGHGGGKRCSFPGCPKCVHGGTAYCVAHGGGKRCGVSGCTKSARGRTDFCVRHGGGKRCRVEGCGKSAQGSTDFCKAHGGGGKRCKFEGCGSFARGKNELCGTHGALVQDQRVHGGATLGPFLQDPCNESSRNIRKEPGVETVGMRGCGNGVDVMGHDIGPVRVCSAEKGAHTSPSPEGRVHGGSLMALLTGSSSLAAATTTTTTSSWLQGGGGVSLC